MVYGVMVDVIWKKINFENFFYVMFFIDFEFQLYLG